MPFLARKSPHPWPNFERFDKNDFGNPLQAKDIRNLFLAFKSRLDLERQPVFILKWSSSMTTKMTFNSNTKPWLGALHWEKYWYFPGMLLPLFTYITQFYKKSWEFLSPKSFYSQRNTKSGYKLYQRDSIPVEAPQKTVFFSSFFGWWIDEKAHIMNDSRDRHVPILHSFTTFKVVVVSSLSSFATEQTCSIRPVNFIPLPLLSINLCAIHSKFLKLKIASRFVVECNGHRSS